MLNIYFKNERWNIVSYDVIGIVLLQNPGKPVLVPTLPFQKIKTELANVATLWIN